MRRISSAGVAVITAPTPSYAGPSCEVCGEHVWGLMVNGSCCAHTACQACWVTSLEARVPDRLEGRCTTVGCLSLECHEELGPALWQILCGESQVLKRFDEEVKSQIALFKQVERKGIQLKWASKGHRIG